MRTVRLGCFISAAVCGAITVAWAQAEAGGLLEACRDSSTAVTAIGGALLMIAGAGFAWSDLRNKVNNNAEAIKRECDARRELEGRVVKLDERTDKLEARGAAQHQELLDAIRNSRRE
jgi:hypothetical protein